MNLFNLVRTDDGKQTRAPTSPARSIGKSWTRSKSSLSPDLCDTSDLSTDTDDVSRDEQLSVNAKLNRAKKRREKASRKLESVLNDKNEQAFRRAQKTLAKRKEQSRKNNKKVKRVKERHSLQEKRRRFTALRSIENRVNGALTRAEENLKKRQGRERKAKRVERVKNKRALIEFDRRSAVLESLGHRTERAARNLQLRLEDLQGKARDEINHAHIVARRVKAARVIQKCVRAKFGLKISCGPSQATLNAAAVKLQNSLAWRSKVVASRLNNIEKMESFKCIITAMVDGASVLSFEETTALITNVDNILSVKSFLDAIDPTLPNSSRISISAQTLLSAFLVSIQPDEVLADKRGRDKCSILLEKAAKKFVDSLYGLSNLETSHDQFSNVLQQVCSNLVSYCTLFNQWKNADLNDLVSKMTKSAEQSWVAYLTSKEALAFIEGKSVEQNVHFQHLLKYKSSKKGAGSHIKRIRAAMKKILGEKQSAAAMNRAKATAVLQIKQEKLMEPIKAEIEEAINVFVETSDECPSPSRKPNTNQLIPENIQSNAKMVHQLLLMDSEDLDGLTKLGSTNFSHLDSVEGFMLQFKNHSASQWIQGVGTVDGIKQLFMDLIEKMRKLVPNRSDLHDHFSSSHVSNCNSLQDFFSLLLSMGDVMVNALESEHRSIVTTQWYDITAKWIAAPDNQNNVPFGFGCWRSYLISSLSFLIGKADLCQAEIVNFKLVHVAPFVQANGKEYEIQHFQQKYGEFSTLQSMENFTATWNWMRRINERDYSGEIDMQLKRGFVDEILFSQESFEMPEVLNMDIKNIHTIREKAKLGVISATLLLVAGKVTKLDFSRLDGTSLSPEAKYYKEKIDALLNSRLPLEIMVQEISESISMFAAKMSGKQLDQHQIQTLTNSTHSILKGNDPVFALMDKRMKTVFHKAATFNFDENANVPIPLEMKTGRQQSNWSSSQKSSFSNKNNNKYKDQFKSFIAKEGGKLGFNIVQDSIVQATYEAHKVILHCVDLYGDVLLKPMSATLKENA